MAADALSMLDMDSESEEKRVMSCMALWNVDVGNSLSEAYAADPSITAEYKDAAGNWIPGCRMLHGRLWFHDRIVVRCNQ